MDPTWDTLPTYTIPSPQSEFTRTPFSSLLQILILCLSEGATQYLLTTSTSSALIVNLPSTNIRTDLLYKSFNILATNPANSNWNYLGAASSLAYEDLRVPTNIALITGTKGEFGSNSLLSSSCWPLTPLPAWWQSSLLDHHGLRPSYRRFQTQHSWVNPKYGSSAASVNSPRRGSIQTNRLRCQPTSTYPQVSAKNM